MKKQLVRIGKKLSVEPKGTSEILQIIPQKLFVNPKGC